MAGIGFLGLLVAMRIDYHSYDNRRLLIAAAAVVAVALVAVLFGPEVKGGRRWLHLAGFGIQPSEAAKFLMVVFAATVLARRVENAEPLDPGLVQAGALLLVFAALIAVEPDLGDRDRARRDEPRGRVRRRTADTLDRRGGPGRAASPDRAALLPQPQSPAAADLARPLRALPGRRVPAGPGVHRGRHGRPVGEGIRRQRAEAVLPARGAQRLHLRGDRRGDRADRIVRDRRVLRGDHRARPHGGASRPRRARLAAGPRASPRCSASRRW